MIGTLYALSALATVLAWTLARRNRTHRPIAWLLSASLGSDLVRHALRVLYVIPVLAPLRGGARLSGWPYAVAIINDALFLVWPASIVACVVAVFLRRRAWPVAVAYAVVVAAFAAFHPRESTGTLGRAHNACELLALTVAIGAGATWYRESEEPTSTAHTTLGVIIAGELATVVGSWRLGVFDHWPISQALYLVLFIMISALQGGYLWQSRTPS
jgi:hypothetical protein